jgi:hypothetical protein
MAESYLYAVDSKFIPTLTLFGLRSKMQGVTVDEDGAFSARPFDPCHFVHALKGL